jgi:mono/diheme cytochrome c family protein
LIAAVAVVSGPVAALALGARSPHAAERAPPRLAEDVQPIFDSKCIACHPVAYPYLDLRRGRSYGDLYRVSAATRPAFERVVPGRPDLSYLLTHPPDPSLRDLLTRDEVETIAEWIKAGARDD